MGKQEKRIVLEPEGAAEGERRPAPEDSGKPLGKDPGEFGNPDDRGPLEKIADAFEGDSGDPFSSQKMGRKV